MTLTELKIQPSLIKPVLKKIGIFDSGIGGISILQKIMDLPGFEFIYFADTAHIPYGQRSMQEIQQLVSCAINFFLQQHIDTVIIACHTASTNALDFLKQQFPTIIFIDVVDLVIEQALYTSITGKIGILATKATTKSEVHKKKLLQSNPSLHIVTQACPRLASAIEKEYTKSDKLTHLVDGYLQPLLKANIDTLILGCTHYALIKNIIEKLIGQTIHLISAETLIKKQLEPFTAAHQPANSSSINWFVTGNREQFKKTVHAVLTIDLVTITKIKTLHYSETEDR